MFVAESLCRFNELGAIPVYSSVTVDECRAYLGNQERTVELLDRIDAGYIEREGATDETIAVSLGRARELILAPEDMEHSAKRMMERLLGAMRFGIGWLTPDEADVLRIEALKENAEFWQRFDAEFADAEDVLIAADLVAIADVARLAKTGMDKNIHDLFMQAPPAVELQKIEDLRRRVQARHQVLQAMPADEQVAYLLTFLSPEDRDHLSKAFPSGFWADPSLREDGNLAGFAFMLYCIGLIGHRKARSGSLNKRMARFLAQFRDCQHIEEASRCGAFLTVDQGGAQLARAVYAYAGVKTEVICLSITSTSA
jgi:hypothetical protein